MLKPTQDKQAILTPDELKAVQDEVEAQDHTFTISVILAICHAIAKEQVAKLERLGYHKGLPPSIEEALNSGDGVYRP